MSILVLEIGDEGYVLALSPSKIDKLKTLSKEEIFKEFSNVEPIYIAEDSAGQVQEESTVIEKNVLKVKEKKIYNEENTQSL